jgi:hypothetical protein
LRQRSQAAESRHQLSFFDHEILCWPRPETGLVAALFSSIYFVHEGYPRIPICQMPVSEQKRPKHSASAFIVSGLTKLTEIGSAPTIAINARNGVALEANLDGFGLGICRLQIFTHAEHFALDELAGKISTSAQKGQANQRRHRSISYSDEAMRTPYPESGKPHFVEIDHKP